MLCTVTRTGTTPSLAAVVVAAAGRLSRQVSTNAAVPPPPPPPPPPLPRPAYRSVVASGDCHGRIKAGGGGKGGKDVCGRGRPQWKAAGAGKGCNSVAVPSFAAQTANFSPSHLRIMGTGWSASMGMNMNMNMNMGRVVVAAAAPAAAATGGGWRRIVEVEMGTPTTIVQLRRSSSFFGGGLSRKEVEEEKERVASLSSYQREMELRDLDAKIARLNTLRGINTGELYTWRGKFKALARDYGVGFMVWYSCIWTSTCALTYAAIEVGGIDAIAILARVDGWTGWEISTRVDPTLGTIGLTIVINELLEPLRLPIVVSTTKLVVDFFTKRY